MAMKSMMETFNIERKVAPKVEVKDYDIFPDKFEYFDIILLILVSKI